MVMGSQFWWFYDVLAVAAVMIMVFLSGRRGIFKSLLQITGYFLAFVIAFSVSGSISEGFYKNSVRNSNVKKVTKSVASVDFIAEVTNYIEEEFGFSGEIEYSRLEKIYTEKNSLGLGYDEQIYQYVSRIYIDKITNENAFYRKLHEGYGEIINGIVSENLVAYAGETAASEIVNHPETMNKLIPLLLDPEGSQEAAEYITDSYTGTPYKKIIRLISFMAVLVLLVAVTVFLVNSTFKTAGFQSLGSHIGGALTGILPGLVIVVFIAACVRLNVICGEDKMLFFNNAAIEKTYLFKHIYGFITSNF